MDEFQNLFNNPEYKIDWRENDFTGREQSVVIYFNYGMEDDEPFYELGDKLRTIMDERKLGVYDGHEMELFNADGSYYLYGPSAEKIFIAVKPYLESTAFMKGAIAVLRFGREDDSPLLEVDIF